MSKDKLVGLIAAAVVLIVVIVGGIYEYQRKAAPPAPSEPTPTAQQRERPGKPAPQSEAKKTEAPKPTSVPSFDVVRIEGVPSRAGRSNSKAAAVRLPRRRSTTKALGRSSSKSRCLPAPIRFH
jgi:hypothetical protein